MMCIPQVLAGVQVQISTDNTTWVDVTNTTYGGSIDETNKIATAYGLTENKVYYIRAKDDVTSWNYKEFITEGGDEMAALSVALFFMVITGSLYALSFRKQLFKNEYLNFIIKRCFLILGIYMTVLTSAVIGTISNSQNLGLSNEIYLIMEYFGWAGYVAMIYLCFSTIVETFRVYYDNKHQERMGYDYD